MKLYKIYRISNKVYQNWILAEKQMAIWDKDGHPTVISHNEIGKVIFGDNLQKAKNYILVNAEKSIQIIKLNLNKLLTNKN